MISIARLFGKSPFAPLQTHMKKIQDCVQKLAEIIYILPKQDSEKIEKLSKELSALENQADLTKNDIRNHLPKSLFLPMDRSHFLDILSIQDSIADKTEEIGILLSLSKLEIFQELQAEFEALFKKNEETFLYARKIIQEIEELLESSFGGIEAEKVKNMVEETAAKENEASTLQRKFMKKVFSHSESLSPPAFYLWLKISEELGCIAKLSERLANRIRMVLELK